MPEISPRFIGIIGIGIIGAAGIAANGPRFR
jgi:hypothetical protein